MTCIQASPNDRHANRRRPIGDRNLHHAPAIRHRLGTLLIGIALVLSASQAISAGSLIAESDTGVSGTGVMDESARSQSLIALSQGSSGGTVPSGTADAFDSRAATEWAGADSALRALQSPQIDASMMCVTCFTVV